MVMLVEWCQLLQTENAAALVIDSSSGIEHKSDLERVVSNLTEYLNAK